MTLMHHKVFGKLPKGEALKRIQQSPNYYKGQFRNPIKTGIAVNPFNMIQNYANSDAKLRSPQFEVPVQKPSFTDKPSNDLKLCWLGHASSIIEMEGKRIVTDPVLCKRVAPTQLAGPKRLHKAPLNANDLPEIDILIISHNHYDHLDFETICSLKNRPNLSIIVPLALGATLIYWGVPESQIIELDWWQSVVVKDICITATPARHFTRRGLTDGQKTLWASWAIEGKEKKVFFQGDSGYFDGYKEVGERFNGFDVALCGIGAYNDLWQNIHTNPEEAIQLCQDVGSVNLLPIHWATFDLAMHPWDEPIERLVKAAETTPVNLLLPQVGQQFELTTQFTKWWYE